MDLEATARLQRAINALAESIDAARQMMLISLRPEMWRQIVEDREAELARLQSEM